MLHRLKNDFRLSIIVLLGTSGVLGITPFAVLRFSQGNVLAGTVDVLILLGVSLPMTYAWLTGDIRRSGLVMAFISSFGAVAVGTLVGDPGLFWLYPCLVTGFFLVAPRIAMAINISAVLLMMMLGDAFRSQEQMWSFAATAVVVSACAYVFAYRNRSQRRRLEHLATIDPLTGVKNRRSMDQELAMAAAQSERTGFPLSLVLLDIDHFKKINDEYGHGVGDEVLVELVWAVDRHTRKYDQLFRYGGEEFVLLMPGLEGAGLEVVLSHLRQVLHRYVRHPGGSVTASFGVASLQHGESVETWLARADDALYRAKSSGRNRVVYADGMEDQPLIEPA